MKGGRARGEGVGLKDKKARRDGLSARISAEQRKESRRERDGGGRLGKQKWEERERETMARVGEESGGGCREGRRWGGGVKRGMRS